MTKLRIIPYNDQHADDFKRINWQWLEQYNLLEPRDIEVLSNPKETILDAGGAIFIAEYDGKVIGTAALMREHDGTVELAKMGVIEEFRGRGISKLLLDACLQKARDWKARKVVLFSNHQLSSALSLYKKYGFRDIPVTGSPFDTADVKMELKL